MKCLRKMILLLLLLSYVLPWNVSFAAEKHAANDEANLDAISQYYAMATVSEAENTYNLPHRDIFINSLVIEEDIALLNAQTDRFLATNGFYYLNGNPCKTRGQIDVPTYTADTDFTDSQKAQEISTMQDTYPEIVIMGDPTSAYNCHSYAWCEESRWDNHWIDSVDLFANDVHTWFLVDEEDAQIGDIVLYFDEPNHISHSAVIQSVTDSSIFCISKWGASVLCMHELEYVPDTYKSADGVCVRAIVRRSEHTGACEYIGANQHTLSCTTCGYEAQMNCNYSYAYIGNNKHNANCVDCGNTASGVSCTFTTTYNDNGTHTISCNNCSNAHTENCNLEYTNLTNTRHSVACTVCDYYVNSQTCTHTYTSNEDKTHTVACTLCGNSYSNNCGFTSTYIGEDRHRRECSRCGHTYTEDCYLENTYCGDETNDHVHRKACRTCDRGLEATEACVFAYKSNGENTHVYACTQCRYVKLGPSPCAFKSDGRCRFCGALENSAVINRQEEVILQD